jgi:hypothetical protein
VKELEPDTAEPVKAALLSDDLIVNDLVEVVKLLCTCVAALKFELPA